jgi:hypothetical protein
VRFKRPSKVFHDMVASGGVRILRLPGAVPFDRGVPLIANGHEEERQQPAGYAVSRTLPREPLRRSRNSRFSFAYLTRNGLSHIHRRRVASDIWRADPSFRERYLDCFFYRLG